MKKVSFKVAKAIKKAGYPQGLADKVYVLEDKSVFTYSMKLAEGTLAHGDARDYCKCVDAPTYIDVWLWLWREKGIYVKDTFDGAVWVWYHDESTPPKYIEVETKDPEETIVATIDYLVENELIK